LLSNTLDLLEATLTAVHITDIVDGVFFAVLLIRDHSAQALTLDARPSDAIALAIRTHSNILATAELLNKAGIEMPAGDGTNQEVEKFREFLDQINPEDFIS
jgi:bifunctional DNase/RNase